MKRYRVLIADDSAAMRSAIAALLSAEPDMDVVGQAGDGQQALELTERLAPDVVLMDFNMPELDGLEATAAIMRRAPARVLLVTALDDDRSLNLAFEAVSAGALELVAKPRGAEPLPAWAHRLATTIRLMAEVPVVSRRRPGDARAGRAAKALEAIGIVASTGGPQVLARVLAGLPADLPVPLFVVQHMPPGFTPGLVRWLGTVTRLRVELAVDGVSPRPGTVYFPPDGSDLVARTAGTLGVELSGATFFASGNRLLESMASVYGPRAGGFVLSGMGDDGAKGLLALRRAGGSTWAQDEESCVVYGMPRAAWETGAAGARVAPDDIARLIIGSVTPHPAS